MAVNKIYIFLDGLFSIVLIPIQFCTTLVLGLIVNLTFGLLLIPISLVWMVFIAPLLGLSWLSGRFLGGRFVVGLLGLPWALLASTFICLMPSMGELESRCAKILLCATWPYSFEFWLFSTGRSGFMELRDGDFSEVLHRAIGRSPLAQTVVDRLMSRESLDAHV
ncbi:MAG: hypothetical protein HOP29_03195 [Phycisphaerales bacterium]|nr:hypothetical protein [Phycisphaerales bacterium]